jgi:hypothetical protein
MRDADTNHFLFPVSGSVRGWLAAALLFAAAASGCAGPGASTGRGAIPGRRVAGERAAGWTVQGERPPAASAAASPGLDDDGFGDGRDLRLLDPPQPRSPRR